MSEGRSHKTNFWELYIPAPVIRYFDTIERNEKDDWRLVYLDSKNIEESSSYGTLKDLYTGTLVDEMIRLNISLKDIEDKIAEKKRYKAVLDKYNKEWDNAKDNKEIK